MDLQARSSGKEILNYAERFITFYNNFQIKKSMNIPINAESVYNPQSVHKGKSWS